MAILDPNTRRRLRRFKEIGRARWSLRILVAIFVLSLLSNFIANDKPLIVKSNGSLFFPILHFWGDHTEDAITGNGKTARAKYKEIEKSEGFADDDSNWMLWTPIKFGSGESLASEEVTPAFSYIMRISPTVRIGSLDLAPDLTIARSRGAEVFAGEKSDSDLRDQPADSLFAVSDKIRAAIALRFENKAAPAIVLPADKAGTMELAFSEYKPRSRPPRTVRASLRDADISSANAERARFESDFSFYKRPPKSWNRYDDPSREKILAAVKNFAADADGKDKVESQVETNLGPRTLSVKPETISFPYQPTKNHPLGIDESGRDAAVQILYATRVSLLFGFCLVISTFVIGIFFGAVQGYFGGKIDLAGQRLMEIWEAMPFLLIMIFLSSVLGRSFWLLLGIYSAFNWLTVTYYTRGEFLKLRKQPFVEAARVMGIGRWKIMFRHILPNALVPSITFFPFALVGAIFVLSALDFLGFGLPAGTPSWGNLLHQGQSKPYAWWLVLYPCLALFIVSLLGVFIGEGLRAAFDPKTKSRIE